MTAIGYIGGDPTKVDVAGWTQGDVLAANLAGTLVAVPIGAAAEVLTGDVTEPTLIDWEPGGGGGGTPSATVVTETAFGQASTAGVSGDYSRGDHTHGTPAAPTAASVGADPAGSAAAAQSAAAAYTDAARAQIADSGFITSGDLAINTTAFVLGPTLSVPAVVGDIIELVIDGLLNNAGTDMQFDAATRVAAADVNYFSTGGAASRFPGGVGAWYVATGVFAGPRAGVQYTVQAGDISAGTVTVQPYGQVGAGSRTMFANATYPLRTRLTNWGPG